MKISLEQEDPAAVDHISARPVVVSAVGAVIDCPYRVNARRKRGEIARGCRKAELAATDGEPWARKAAALEFRKL